MLLTLLARQSQATAPYDWILAITFIAYIFSAFGNGANDVANAYATSVAARTLTMVQVGFLSVITEFFGAVVLGARVTSTIKNGIIDIGRFEGRPGVLMLAMGCAEVGSATWLMFATGQGMPVSTTQTIVGALIGVGFASQASIKVRSKMNPSVETNYSRKFSGSGPVAVYHRLQPHGELHR